MYKQSKKYINSLYIVFLIISIMYMLIQPQAVVNSIKETMSVFVLTVLPSLFPFILCSQMIIMLGGARVIGYPLRLLTNVLKLDDCVSGAYAASLVGGYPSGAASLNLLYEKNELKGNYLCSMLLCSNCGPMFVIATLGTVLLNSYGAGVVILCSHILGGIINTFLFLKFADVKEVHTGNKEVYTKSNFKKDIFFVLDKSIINTSKIMIKIFAFMGLFKLIGDAIFLNIGAGDEPVLVAEAVSRGVLEIMDGCISAAKLDFYTAATVICFIVSFGGLSAVFQSISVAKKIPFSRPLFTAGKFLHGALSALICNVLIRFIPVSVETYSTRDVRLFDIEYHSPNPFMLLLAGCIIYFALRCFITREKRSFLQKF